jgi:hypothetical protein
LSSAPATSLRTNSRLLSCGRGRHRDHLAVNPTLHLIYTSFYSRFNCFTMSFFNPPSRLQGPVVKSHQPLGQMGVASALRRSFNLFDAF